MPNDRGRVCEGFNGVNRGLIKVQQTYVMMSIDSHNINTLSNYLLFSILHCALICDNNNTYIWLKLNIIQIEMQQISFLR